MPNIDFSQIPDSLQPLTIIAGLIAFGVMYASIGFTLWVVREVGLFFDWVDWYRHGDMDNDEHWWDEFGRANSVLNKVGLGR
ncbi:hypothetical protein [Cupriavidus metallidurans]|uniref:hypothetical protein n=1 Tax=Cupriavidus metallidurans TaxID=119219 RepID=UPI001CCD4A5E|nr:hypothetical protein [Cupriavidus metallidurans]UBM11688.1 hypothetical protein LAI70_15205 [Cupriavidus metallidurans]